MQPPRPPALDSTLNSPLRPAGCSLKSMRWLILLVVGGLLAAFPALASAEPVERAAGDYRLTVNFDEDPPLLEDGNALVVQVVDSNGRPVTGLEDDLRFEVDISVGPVTRTSTIDVRRDIDQPGVYEGVFTPPVIGKYDFRVFGTINGAEIDERFVTGEGLADVTAADGYNWSGAGETLAVILLVVYVLGLGGFGVWWLRRRRARKTTTTVA
jgi:hypothetical protein